MSNLKILVTGGAGFIGSHVVDNYISRGHQVVVIDNLHSGFRRNLNKRAKFYKADIRNSGQLKRVFRREKPEIVNHHAAIAEAANSLRDSQKTYEVNVLGTANVLKTAGETGIKKFIFISSGGAIYGSPQELPARETLPPRPLSPYAVSKLLGEELVKFYADFYKFKYLILRYANVYGPRQNPEGEAGVVAIFTRLMSRNRRPTIFGNGNKTRDYVYVADAAKANTYALRRGEGKILNIGFSREIKDQVVFDVLAKTIGFKQKPICAPFRKGEVYRICLDINLAKRAIGWKPTIDFKKGIREYILAVRK